MEIQIIKLKNNPRGIHRMQKKMPPFSSFEEGARGKSGGFLAWQ